MHAAENSLCADLCILWGLHKGVPNTIIEKRTVTSYSPTSAILEQLFLLIQAWVLIYTAAGSRAEPMQTKETATSAGSPVWVQRSKH